MNTVDLKLRCLDFILPPDHWYAAQCEREAAIKAAVPMAERMENRRRMADGNDAGDGECADAEVEGSDQEYYGEQDGEDEGGKNTKARGKESKKRKNKQVSYGRRITREEAYEKIEEFRKDLRARLEKEYEELRAAKQRLEAERARACRPIG